MKRKKKNHCLLNLYSTKKKVKKKKRNCYLYVTKDNASQIACLVFGENDLKKERKGKQRTLILIFGFTFWLVFFAVCLLE